MTMILLSLGLALPSHAADSVRRVTCDQSTLEFRAGEDTFKLNGETRDITWTDDGADALFGDAAAEDAHHLEVWRNGRVSLDDQPCAEAAGL